MVKSNSKGFTMLLIIALFYIFSYAMIFFVDTGDLAETENRTRSGIESIQSSSYMDGTLQEELELALTDHYYFRDNLIGIYKTAKYKLNVKAYMTLNELMSEEH